MIDCTSDVFNCKIVIYTCGSVALFICHIRHNLPSIVRQQESVLATRLAMLHFLRVGKFRAFLSTRHLIPIAVQILPKIQKKNNKLCHKVNSTDQVSFSRSTLSKAKSKRGSIQGQQKTTFSNISHATNKVTIPF